MTANRFLGKVRKGALISPTFSNRNHVKERDSPALWQKETSETGFFHTLKESFIPVKAHLSKYPRRCWCHISERII